MAERSDPIDLALGGPLALAANRPVEFRLSWDSAEGDDDPIDLDLGCFYWARDGSRGAIQSVGSHVGAGGEAPVVLDGGERLMTLSEDQVGDGAIGERLVVHRPVDLPFLVLHVSIYSGAADFRSTGARVTVSSAGRPLAWTSLDSAAPGLYWCAVLVLGAKGRRLFVAAEERYFRSAYHADRHYGLGQRWGPGRKEMVARG